LRKLSLYYKKFKIEDLDLNSTKEELKLKFQEKINIADRLIDALKQKIIHLKRESRIFKVEQNKKEQTMINENNVNYN